MYDVFYIILAPFNPKHGTTPFPPCPRYATSCRFK